MARRLTNFASHTFASWCYIIIRYLRTANETLHTINHRGLLRKFLPVQSKYFKFLFKHFKHYQILKGAFLTKSKKPERLQDIEETNKDILSEKNCNRSNYFDFFIQDYFLRLFFQAHTEPERFFDPHSWSYPKSKSASDSYRIFTNNLFTETTEKSFFFNFVVSHGH